MSFNQTHEEIKLVIPKDIDQKIKISISAEKALILLYGIPEKLHIKVIVKITNAVTAISIFFEKLFLMRGNTIIGKNSLIKDQFHFRKHSKIDHNYKIIVTVTAYLSKQYVELL